MTSGSGDRPRKEGSCGGGIYSFFPLFRISLLRTCGFLNGGFYVSGFVVPSKLGGFEGGLSVVFCTSI